jgi:hypothetical protein
MAGWQGDECAFVDAPFRDGQLRLEGADHEPAPLAQADAAWARFAVGG